MQAVILAAGKSTRTYPLTLTKPKPLLKIAGMTIIEHNLEQLRGVADEVIVVAGYKAEMLKNFLGENYRGIKIKYVLQEEMSGNASALALVREHIKDKFILMFGDDLYSRMDIRNILKYDNAILAQKVDNPSSFGVLKVDGDRFLEVIEKPQEFISDLVNIGCFVFSQDIFQVLDDIQLSTRGEYELTDAYNLLAKRKDITVVPIKDFWLPTTYPWSMLKANNFLLQRIKTDLSRKSKIEKGVTIKGQVVVGDNTVIKSGVYIEGPVIIGAKCVIGPNTYLRAGTVIGNNCHIGQAVEIKNSIIGNNSNVAHLSYVGDSILGDGVNFGAGTITANLRHDGKNIKSMAGENLVDSGMKKLGAVLGDGVKTGIHTSFYPGVKIDPEMTTLPGDIVQKDIRSNG
ncbi:MAG: sugar phosphate nucleotidyltransferase [Candidatus Pacebacteria bacterium]|nr:sugar phosphate nucleotidyltransferase [Candidatus Paceibacterota bacterium]